MKLDAQVLIYILEDAIGYCNDRMGESAGIAYDVFEQYAARKQNYEILLSQINPVIEVE